MSIEYIAVEEISMSVDPLTGVCVIETGDQIVMQTI